MDALEFARSAYQDPGGPAAYTTAHRDLIDLELAEGLRKLAQDWLRSGRFEQASAIAQLGAWAHSELGNRAEALDCLLMVHQVHYQLASTVDQYAKVRSELINDAGRAGGGDDSWVFRVNCLGFAAQCGYFAGREASAPHPAEDLIQQSLEDIKQLLSLHPPVMSPASVQRFMAFAFATLDLATARLWLDERGRIAALLHELAVDIEARIPADATLAEDSARDSAMAEVLARLTDHGG